MNKLQKLAAKNTNPFPLRSSLFWRDIQDEGWKGTGYKSTWELLKRNWDAATRARLMKKQVEYKSNFLTFYLYHYDDPDCIVNPFIGNPDPKKIAAGKAAWDLTEITKWMPYLALGNNPDYWIVPTLFCGDSKSATQNTAFHDMFIPQVVQFIHPFIKGINLGSEMTKTMTWAQIGRMAMVVKNAWKAAGQQPHFVLVHIQCDGGGNFKDCTGKIGYPPDVDAILLETSNHPKDFNNNIIAEIKKVVAKCPKYVLVQEAYIFCEEARARKQVQDIAKIPGVWMLPGPI